MIQAVNLTKRFEDKVALDAVNFTIGDGTIYGLVGSNGSGKSTLLRLISGVYVPDDGTITVDGENTFNNPEIKSKICYLADTPYFIHQSDLVEMSKFYKKMYPSFSYERFNYLLEIFPIDRKTKINTMSKGMQRQAALILSMSTMPKYLLLDEAFDGLDPVMRKVLKSILAEGVSDGMTAIIASHNLTDLDFLCDRVGLLHYGSIIFNDDINNIKQNIHKVQMAFNMVPDMSVFDSLDVIKSEKTGSLIRLIVRGNEDEILGFIKKLNPNFFEVIPPTFEEVFMYELEVKGYDSENILK